MTDTADAGTVDTTTGTDPVTPPAAAAVDYQAEAEKWKALSRKHEKQAKENADAASAATARQESLNKVLAALGIEGTGPKGPDIDAVTQQLAAAQAATTAQARENAILRQAGKLGADGDALLDSRAFLAAVSDVDPADTAGISAAIAEAVKTNPRYATGTAPAAPAAPPRSTATSFEGAPGGQRQWTAEDVAKASPAAMQKALKDGLLAAYLAS